MQLENYVGRSRRGVVLVLVGENLNDLFRVGLLVVIYGRGIW